MANALSLLTGLFAGTGGVNLILGDTVFQGFEIPEEIKVPGKQALAVHKMLGGARQIDAMGADPGLICWSGRFRGETAESRAQHLALLRDKGLPLSLTWNSYRFLVVIESFEVQYQQGFEIPYSISCEVVQNLSLPILVSIPGLSLSIVNDISTGLTISNSLGLTAITDGMNALQSSLNAGTLANATPATAKAAQGSIAAVQAPVAAAVLSNNALLAPAVSSGGLAGLTSGVSPVQAAAALTTSANASTSLGQLLPLANVLSRMSINAGSLGK